MILAIPAHLLLASCALQAAGDELIPNGSIEGRDTWRPSPSRKVEGAILRFDPDEGAGAPGSLYLSCSKPSQLRPISWTVTVELPAPRPTRLVLTANIRAQDLAEGAEAQVTVQLLIPNGARGPDSSARVTWEDTDWRQTRFVFDVPENVIQVRVHAQLKGVGNVWFDDFSLKTTDEELRGVEELGLDWATVPEEAAHWESLARKSASELPWLFDSKAARERAAREGKPILVYLRCTDDLVGLASMQATLEGRDASLMDDGYAKDLLFRAGPLSVPEVGALIFEHFVPVCLTYDLDASVDSADTPPAWRAYGYGGGRLWASPEDGNSTSGYLAIDTATTTEPDPNNAAIDGGQSTGGYWVQCLAWRAESPVTIRFAARLRAADLEKGSFARVKLECRSGWEHLASATFSPVRSDTDWVALEGSLTVPEGVDKIVLYAELVGAGRAWFDDFVITLPERQDNLLVNGALDRLTVADGFELDFDHITTPALIVFDPDGRRISHLHRIGTMSDDLLFRWLRDVLAEVTPKAPVSDYLTEDPDLRRVLAHLRKGEWSSALDVLGSLGEDASERALFWRAWCLYRQGHYEAARNEWKGLVLDQAMAGG